MKHWCQDRDEVDPVGIRRCGVTNSQFLYRVALHRPQFYGGTVTTRALITLVALRAPMAGDPAFDGLELQMADPCCMPLESPMAPAELIGALYRAVAPKVQFRKPHRWVCGPVCNISARYITNHLPT